MVQVYSNQMGEGDRGSSLVIAIRLYADEIVDNNCSL